MLLVLSVLLIVLAVLVLLTHIARVSGVSCVIRIRGMTYMIRFLSLFLFYFYLKTSSASYADRLAAWLGLAVYAGLQCVVCGALMPRWFHLLRELGIQHRSESRRAPYEHELRRLPSARTFLGLCLSELFLHAAGTSNPSAS